MTTINTSELTGAALDWAVATSKGYSRAALTLGKGMIEFKNMHEDGYHNYSTDWSQGGSIIERERINVGDNCPTGWQASKRKGVLSITGQGPTPLIAAMRCYVASKLGDTIEVPEELTK